MFVISSTMGPSMMMASDCFCASLRKCRTRTAISGSVTGSLLYLVQHEQVKPLSYSSPHPRLALAEQSPPCQTSSSRPCADSTGPGYRAREPGHTALYWPTG